MSCQNSAVLTRGFNHKLNSGDQLTGTIISLPTPAVTEAVSRIGYDWLWIDMEHGNFSLLDVENILRAKSPECAGVVRIPNNDDTWIKRVLELGADGIIVPQVKSKNEAEEAVRSSKYPPVGTRSVGLARAQCHGLESDEYLRTANEKLSVILQIEHRVGVANLDSILEVTGIDGIIIGPYDLSASFGKPGQIDDPEVLKAIETIRTKCMDKKIPHGIFTMSDDLGSKYLQEGFQLVCLGIDIQFLWSHAKSKLESMKVTRV